LGAPRIRDLELLQMAADLLLALQGRAKGEVDITGIAGTVAASAGGGGGGASR
jgi:transcription-repair coupling factor (superfamily II helicase)